MSVPEQKKRDIKLGPFFTGGLVLLVYGLLRRKAVVIAVGLGSIWFDQRTELGRSVKQRIIKAMSVPVVEDDGDRPVADKLDPHP